LPRRIWSPPFVRPAQPELDVTAEQFSHLTPSRCRAGAVPPSTSHPHREPDRAKARIGIRWHADTADQLIIDRPGPSGIPAATPSPAAGLIRRLGPVTGNDELAAILARHGYLTGVGRPFDVKAVQWVRHVYKVPVPSPVAGGEVSVKDAAAQLGCSTGVYYYWIETGQLQSRRGTGNRIAISWDPAIQARCRVRIAESGHLNPGARRTRPRKAPRWPLSSLECRVSAPSGIIQPGTRHREKR
jgi:hypothetical protein